MVYIIFLLKKQEVLLCSILAEKLVLRRCSPSLEFGMVKLTVTYAAKHLCNETAEILSQDFNLIENKVVPSYQLAN